MKYVWMMILGIAWIWWTVEMIKDVWCCHQQFYHPFQHIKDYTKTWFEVHSVLGTLAFLISLFLWLMDKRLIGG